MEADGEHYLEDKHIPPAMSLAHSRSGILIASPMKVLQLGNSNSLQVAITQQRLRLAGHILRMQQQCIGGHGAQAWKTQHHLAPDLYQ